MDGKLRNMASVYIVCKEKILLLYRQGGRVVNNVWVASAGGHFEENELNDARSCVMRECEEELGITEKVFKNFRMRYVALRRIKGEIRQNYYFFAEIEDEKELNLISNEGILQWFDISEVDSLEMPYTAKYVVKHYVDVARYDERLYCAIGDGNGLVFVELPDYEK